MNISKKIIEKMNFDFNEFNIGFSQICPNLKLTHDMIWSMPIEELMELMEINMYESFQEVNYGGYRMVADRTGDLLGDLYGPFEVGFGIMPNGNTNREIASMRQIERF